MSLIVIKILFTIFNFFLHKRLILNILLIKWSKLLTLENKKTRCLWFKNKITKIINFKLLEYQNYTLLFSFLQANETIQDWFIVSPHMSCAKCF